MYREAPERDEGLVSLYVFDAAGVKEDEGGGGGDGGVRPAHALDRRPAGNHLALRSNPPSFVYSYAPLTAPDGGVVPPPTPGAGGHALRLHDRQVCGERVCAGGASPGRLPSPPVRLPTAAQLPPLLSLHRLFPPSFTILRC